jgi:hypothetical protein
VILVSDQGELEVRPVMRLRGNSGLSSSFDGTLDGRRIDESEFRESAPVSGVLTRRAAACARGDQPGP